MSFGAKTWDDSGAVRLDTTVKMLRVLDEIPVNKAAGDGSKAVAGFNAAKGGVVYIPYPVDATLSALNNGSIRNGPHIELNGNTVSWSWIWTGNSLDGILLVYMYG